MITEIKAKYIYVRVNNFYTVECLNIGIQLQKLSLYLFN